MNTQVSEVTDNSANVREVEITVNDHPVVAEGPRLYGREIKQAAIAQGVKIQLDFVLSIEKRGGGKTKIVGDDDEVAVHNCESFLAIPNDDNS